MFHIRKNPLEIVDGIDFLHPVAIIPHSERIRKVIWSSDDSCIYTSTEDGIIRWFSVENIKKIASTSTNKEVIIEPITLQRLNESINDIELSMSHNLLTIAAGKSIYFLQTDTLEIVDKIQTTFDVETASLHSMNRNFVLAGGSDMAIHAYNLSLAGDKSSSRQVLQLPGHHGAVHAIRFTGVESRTFLSGADDATIRIWETESAFSSHPK